MSQSKEYSHKRLTRLITHYGSIRSLAFFSGIHQSTISKYLKGTRTKLRKDTCTVLDLLYIQTF